MVFTFYYTRVRPQCDFSIFGRCKVGILWSMELCGVVWSCVELCADVVFSEHFIKLCSEDVLCCILTLENVYLGTQGRRSNVYLRSRGKHSQTSKYNSIPMYTTQLVTEHTALYNGMRKTFSKVSIPLHSHFPYTFSEHTTPFNLYNISQHTTPFTFSLYT